MLLNNNKYTKIVYDNDTGREFVNKFYTNNYLQNFYSKI